MTLVTTLVAHKHWDHYRVGDVSKIGRRICHMSRSEGGVTLGVRAYFSRVWSRGMAQESRSRVRFGRVSVCYTRCPKTGSNPTMIDLINWGE